MLSSSQTSCIGRTSSSGMLYLYINTQIHINVINPKININAHLLFTLKQTDTVDANWGDPSQAQSVKTVVGQPTRVPSHTASPNQSGDQNTPSVVGTSYDMGVGWAETHYYERQTPSEKVRVLN